MKRRMFYLLSMLVVLSMFLGACTTPATEAPKPSEPPKPTEALEPTKSPEPTEAPGEPEKPVEPTKAAPEDMDNAYSGMLDSMVAYNTIKADMLLAEIAEDNPHHSCWMCLQLLSWKKTVTLKVPRIFPWKN